MLRYLCCHTGLVFVYVFCCHCKLLVQVVVAFAHDRLFYSHLHFEKVRSNSGQKLHS
jgi:hypothetical protein